MRNNRLRILITAVILVTSASISLAQNDWYAPYEEAKNAIKTGNWDLAEQKLNLAIKANPKSDRQARPALFFVSYTPYFLLGKVYFNQKKWQLAIDTLKKDQPLFKTNEKESGESASMISAATVELQKRDVQPLIQKIREMISQSDLSGARIELQKLKDIDSANPASSELEKEIQNKENEMVTASIQRLNSLISSGDLDRADQEYRNIKNTFPRNAKITEFENKLDAARNDIATLVKDARASIDREDLSTAKSKVEEIKKRNSKDPSIAALELAIGQKERPILVKNDLKKLIDQLNTAVATRNWKTAAALSDEIRKSEPVNSEVLRVKPQVDAGLKYMDLIAKATAEKNKGNYREARNFLQQARSLQSDQNEVNSITKAIDLAENWDALEKAVRSKNLPLAQRLYASVQEMDPNNPRLTAIKSSIFVNTTPPPPPTIFPSREEEPALKAYYRGDYATAAAKFDELKKKKSSAYIIFYLACSHGALGLKDGNQNAIKLAKQEFAALRSNYARFDPDTRFISPRIVKLFNLTN